MNYDWRTFLRPQIVGASKARALIEKTTERLDELSKWRLKVEKARADSGTGFFSRADSELEVGCKH